MSKKILSVLLTAVLLVATFCVVVPSASALTGTIYFQVPADWATDYTEVYCHYWGEDGITSPDWQSAAEVCTNVADGIYGYVLPEGNVTGLVFSVNNADKNQTADITNLDDAAGKIATIDGDTCTWVEPTTELGEVKPVETTEEPGEVTTTGSEISGKIYFEIPEAWKSFEKVYCHVWDAAGTSVAGWQTEAEECTKESDNLYSYEIPAGAWTNAIFSNDSGLQTGDTPLTAAEIGKVMYYTGNQVENPVNGEMVDEAAWKDLEVVASEAFGGTIYFEIPEAWKSFEKVYCHVWGTDGDLAGWQTEAEECTKVNDKLYSFTIPEGNWTNAIFSNDSGLQTGDTALTAAEMGKVMYYTGNKVENPVTGDMVDEAAWKDYSEAPAESEAPASEPEAQPEPEKSNNIALYIIICAAVVILIIIIIVVVAKKKKK